VRTLSLHHAHSYWPWLICSASAQTDTRPHEIVPPPPKPPSSTRDHSALEYILPPVAILPARAACLSVTSTFSLHADRSYGTPCSCPSIPAYSVQASNALDVWGRPKQQSSLNLKLQRAFRRLSCVQQRCYKLPRRRGGSCQKTASPTYSTLTLKPNPTLGDLMLQALSFIDAHRFTKIPCTSLLTTTVFGVSSLQR
jgi:hypothetical protein